MVEDRRDHGTRDMAVEAKVLINEHMRDCVGWRMKLEDRLSTLGTDIKTLNNRLMLVIGGIVVIGKLLDWGTPLVTSIFHR